MGEVGGWKGRRDGREPVDEKRLRIMPQPIIASAVRLGPDSDQLERVNIHYISETSGSLNTTRLTPRNYEVSLGDISIVAVFLKNILIL